MENDQKKETAIENVLPEISFKMEMAGIHHFIGNSLGRIIFEAGTIENWLPHDLPQKNKEGIFDGLKGIRTTLREVTLCLELLGWAERRQVDVKSQHQWRVISAAEGYFSSKLKNVIESLERGSSIYGYPDPYDNEDKNLSIKVRNDQNIDFTQASKDNVLMPSLIFIAGRKCKNWIEKKDILGRRRNLNGFIEFISPQVIKFTSDQLITDSRIPFDPQAYQGDITIAHWLMQFFIDQGWHIDAQIEDEYIQTVKIKQPDQK